MIELFIRSMGYEYMDKLAITEDIGNVHSFPSQNSSKPSLCQAGGIGRKQSFLHRVVDHREPLIKQMRSPEITETSTDIPPGQRPAVVLEVACQHEPPNASITRTDQATEQKSKSTGEFYFANNPLDKQRIIDQLHFEQRHEQPLTIWIRSLEDLEKHGLMQQTWLNQGQLHKAEGRLFTDEPLTLVFDLTTMTPGDIACFNDLLQVGPRCNDKPLGDRVRRVFLVNDRMLNGSQPANPDLWRRLAQMTDKTVSTASLVADSVTDDTLLSQRTTAISTDKPAIAIDFATSDDWYNSLFGGITLNARGQLVFVAGALASLKDTAHLVLKNAPWDSADFRATLATAIRNGGFEANRRWVRLPEHLTLSRDQISGARLNTLKQQAIKENEAFHPESPFVCINANSIENLKSPMRVAGSVVVRTDSLATVLKDCQQMVITSELDERQWLWLLTQLAQLPDNKRPSLFAHLPLASLISVQAAHRGITTPNQPYSERCGSENSAVASFVYQINPKDTLDSLQQVNLTSQNRFTFSLTNSPLLERLVNGTPVILYGLERNPALAANLETLLLPAPYLFIHGHKIDLPRAQVTFIKPSGEQTTGSVLINQLFSTTNSQQPPPENPIYSLLKSLPRSSQRNYPDRPPWTAECFQDRFDRQAEAERLMDGSPERLPCHQRRALHVLLAKAYRGDPKVYSFIKAKISHYYPDRPANNRADRSALEQWLAHHPNPELKDIRAHFWTLARHCPATLHQSIETLDKIRDSAVKQLASYLVAATPLSLQRSLARRLKVNLRLATQQPFFNGSVRSTLRDALIAHRPSLKRKTIISKTVETLENEISSVLITDQTDQQKSQQIRNLLAACFIKHQLPEHCQDLAAAILAQQRHTHTRQERRLEHLTQQVQEYPIVFLQGEAGAGKTFMAQAIAARAGYPGCQVIQLGPNDTSETLFADNSWSLIPPAVGRRITAPNFGKGRSCSGQYRTIPPAGAG